MKIDRIELREIRLPLVMPFETSFGRTYERRMVLVKVFSEGGHGWGECTVGEKPFYNHEYTESCWSVIRDFAGPMVLGTSVLVYVVQFTPWTCAAAAVASPTAKTGRSRVGERRAKARTPFALVKSRA